MSIEFVPIGVIHSPFSSLEGMPIQPSAAHGVKGHIEVSEEYQPGLRDLDGFSHLVVLYHFHRSSGYDLQVVPFLDTGLRGLFATRAPKRPNPIGLSVLQLDGIKAGRIEVSNIDIIDGTPLLDTKPYVPEFDRPTEVRIGWLEKAAKDIAHRRSDNRFK